MLRWLVVSLMGMLALLEVLSGMAGAQTATGSSPSASLAGPTGAFDRLSPGNRETARALFEAQNGSATRLTLDEIAARKQRGEGWGEIFQDMKRQGLVDAKNLGQVVSGGHRAGSSGVVGTGANRAYPTGSSRQSGRTTTRDDEGGAALAGPSGAGGHGSGGHGVGRGR